MQETIPSAGTARSRFEAVDVAVLLPLVILIGGSINGLAARIVDAVATQGLSLLPGVSPFEALAIFAAARLMLSANPSDADRRGGWDIAGLATVAAIFFPSSAVSWLAIGTYAAAIAWWTRGDMRSGALLFAALAAASLWSVVFLNRLTLPVTSAEAWLAASILGLFADGITHAGNIISNAGGHKLIVLAQCSAFDGLPRAMVGLAAVASIAGGIGARRLAAAMALAATLYFAANVVRLVLMASSAEAYDVVHGPTGSNVYDLLQTLAVLGIGIGAARR